MSNKTYGILKQRVISLLAENDAYDEGCLVNGIGSQAVISRIPDALGEALVRVYESLPVGQKQCSVRAEKASIIAYEKKFPTPDKSEILFFSPGGADIYFEYYGEGQVLITNENNNILYSFRCDNEKKKAVKRVKIEDNPLGDFKVTTMGNVDVRNFTAYSMNGFSKQELIAPYGKDSFELPEDFGKCLSASIKNKMVAECDIKFENGVGYINSSACTACDELDFVYTRSVPSIDSQTSDDFEFELCDIGFEALLVLTASLLCRYESAELYTRLIYKYNDLVDGMYSANTVSARKNSFFKSTSLRR